MSLPFVSVVVPVYNGRQFVKGCLESLLRQDYPKDRCEVLVVDNGSTDGTEEEIRRYPVTCVLKPSPPGPSAVRNAGILRARGELIAFTDIDCIADAGWLSHLVEGWDDPRYGGFVGRIEPSPASDAIQQWMAQFFDQQKNLVAVPLAFAQTGNVAYRRDVLVQIGGFDEGLRWWGDAELAFRMQQRTAYTYKWNPEAIVYHRTRDTIRRVASKFFGRGYGRTAVAKREPKLRQPSLAWWAAHHGMRACIQLGKLGVRAVQVAVTRSGREALLQHELWLTFHAAMACGLVIGWVDRRNGKVVIPSLDGHA